MDFVGWLFGRRVGLVVQDRPVAHEGLGGVVAADELRGNYEMFFRSAHLAFQLQFSGAGIVRDQKG